MYIPVPLPEVESSTQTCCYGSRPTTVSDASPHSKKRKRDANSHGPAQALQYRSSSSLQPSSSSPADPVDRAILHPTQSYISSPHNLSRPSLSTLSHLNGRKRARRVKTAHALTVPLPPSPPPSKSVPLPSQSYSHSQSHATLTDCHICHRRPTTKSQLSSYAPCEACAQRTCYICLRECEGPDCGMPLSSTSIGTGSSSNERTGGGAVSTSMSMRTRKRICSGCCVEHGSEGIVTCLACLDRIRDGPDGDGDEDWTGGKWT